MKNIISYFIKFPVAVNIFILIFVVFGLFGGLSMKSSFFPLSPSRNISINLIYPGASPLEMEEGIVLKVEDNLKGIIGIDRVVSVSRENSASINIEIERGKNIDVVLADVKNAVDRVPSFPSGMEPPVIAKIENIRSSIDFSISGKGIPLATLKEYARKIENDLRNMEGISQVSLTGFPDQEIEIAIRENDMRAYNLTFAQVANIVRETNILITGGTVKTFEEDYLIRANNRNYYGDELYHLVVKADKSGNIIRLSDIADVKDTWSENPDRILLDNEMAIEIRVSNTNNEDLMSTTEQVNAYIKRFNKEHTNIALNVSRDLSITLGQRTNLLLKNIFYGVLLVLLFLSLFLNIRVALWVALGMPISFLGMFMMATQFDITINIFSLFGMIIVIGILVDDGIVIGENIYHHYETGKSALRAAIDGTLEVIPPIASAIFTTIVAFATFYFLDGRMGDMFSEVGTVVILTLLVSLVEALIILPAHLAHGKAMAKNNGEGSYFSRTFGKINSFFDRGLKKVRDRWFAPVITYFINNRVLGFAIPIALFMVTIAALMGGVVRTSFFPSIASDRISVTLSMPQGTNEHITDSVISLIEAAALEIDKEFTAKQTGNLSVVQNIVKRIGPGTANASLSINLLPGESREFSSPEITNALRDKVGVIHGVEKLIFGSGGNFGGSPISVSLLGSNIEELKAAKIALKDELQANPMLKDVSDNDPQGIKEIRIVLKDNAYLLGLTLQTVLGQVRSGFFGVMAQRFQRGQDEIRVWVRYAKEDRSSITDLDNMWIVTATGKRVPFSEIANYEIIRGEVAINHLNGKREIQITADMLSKKDSPIEIIDDIKQRIMPQIQALYPTVFALYEGQNRESKKTVTSLKAVGPIILAVIYILIAFTFRSYSQPLLLLIMVPFSLIGVVWGHYIHGFQINILSWLGIIALLGIMVNDGLVLVGKFNSFLREGLKFNDALIQASISRFRAIVLTSLTTVAGLAPLLLEESRQAQFLKPMAISISYGIIIGTFLTLLMLPLLLSLGNSFKVFIKWLRTGKEVTKEEVERAIIEKRAAEEADAIE
ncbi:MAG: efflux RND transporter permease subunit [Bacteroidales bacterium]|nr:efflux RND transporter permease subunit [Bacteroidales bacterium]